MAEKQQCTQSADPGTTCSWFRLVRFIPSTVSDRLIRTPERAGNHLDLEIDMYQYNFDEGPRYNALSYAWGDRDQPMRSILLSGKEILIPLNLFGALSAVQATLDQEWATRLQDEHQDPAIFIEDWVWVDQLSINQCDLEEKNMQVGLMSEIYSRAASVFVWLGPATESTKLGMDFANDLSECYTHDDGNARALARLQSSSNLQAELIALAEIFDRPYWKRMWIVQEYTALSQVDIWCGQHHLLAKRLWVAQNVAINQYSRDCTMLIVQQLLTIDEQDTRQRMQDALFQWGTRSLHRTQDAINQAKFNYSDGWMLWLMSSHRWRQASDAKDMVYALVNLFNKAEKENMHPIPIDYRKSTSDVFIDFMRGYVQIYGNLTVLRYLTGRPSAVRNLPSWAIDWASQDIDHLVILEGDSRADRPCPCGDTGEPCSLLVLEMARDWLRAEGVRIGSIDELSPKILTTRAGSVHDTLREFDAWLRIFAKTDEDDEQKLENLGLTIGAGISAFSSDYYSAESLETARDISADILRLFRHQSPQTALEVDPPDFILRYGNKESASSSVEVPKLSMWDSRAGLSNQYNMAGKVPAAAEIGDVLCVLFGCPLVIVARQHEDGFYRMVGTSWFGSFMRGEAMKMVGEGKLKPETFRFR